MENASFWLLLICWIPLLIIFLESRRFKRLAVIRHTLNLRKTKFKELPSMKELAAQFIGKDCLLYTMNGQVSGIVKDIMENGLLLDCAGKPELINLDYVTRIREYPHGKNGKRKSVVYD